MQIPNSFFHLLGLPSDRIPRGKPMKILYQFPISKLATCPIHRCLLYFTTATRWPIL